MYSLHHKRPKSTSGLRLLKIAKKVNGHDTYSNSILNSKMKVLQVTENVDFFFAVLESGENSKKAIIILYGPRNTTVPPLKCTQTQIDMI